MSEPCKVKRHFECDGSGQMCHVCGESEHACGCDEVDYDFGDCEGCNGTGWICVAHEAPSLSDIGPCDGVVHER